MQLLISVQIIVCPCSATLQEWLLCRTYSTMEAFHSLVLPSQSSIKWKNNMTWVDVLGLFGAFLSSVTFVPQVYKAWKTKSTGDLSVWMIFILMANVSTWLTYGIIKNDLAIILANAIILSLSLLLLFFKLTFKNSTA